MAQPVSIPDFQPRAVVFDLLTAVLDSWSVWDTAALSEDAPSLSKAHTDGQRWRKRYLELTYGCGSYQPYESLVEQSAADVGLSSAAPKALLQHWDKLKTWPEVPAVMAALKRAGLKLGVVTNCSNELGHRAIELCCEQVRQAKGGEGFTFDAVVTAEESGFYKPNAKPYEDVLAKLAMPARDVLFVAGSASDVPGASGVGMRVCWHNRVGLASKGGVQPLKEGKTMTETLEGIVPVD